MVLYFLYGPLAEWSNNCNLEGVPSYPDFSRFWEIIEKHQVNQFYTAPNKSFAKESLDFVQ
jgi:acetyl-CoA synthetase